jgi:hypothetical protein
MNQTQDPTQMEHDHPATTTVPTVPMNLAANAPPNMENNDRPGDYIFTAYHKILSKDEPGYPGTPREYSWQDLLDIDPDIPATPYTKNLGEAENQLLSLLSYCITNSITLKQMPPKFIIKYQMAMNNIKHLGGSWALFISDRARQPPVDPSTKPAAPTVVTVQPYTPPEPNKGMGGT